MWQWRGVTHLDGRVPVEAEARVSFSDKELLEDVQELLRVREEQHLVALVCETS